MNHGGSLVHIVEYTMLADANLPGRVKVFPWWNETAQQLSIASLDVWLVEKLGFNGFNHLLSNERRQGRNFCSGVLVDINLKCGHWLIESDVGATRC